VTKADPADLFDEDVGGTLGVVVVTEQSDPRAQGHGDVQVREADPHAHAVDLSTHAHGAALVAYEDENLSRGIGVKIVGNVGHVSLPAITVSDWTSSVNVLDIASDVPKSPSKRRDARLLIHAARSDNAGGSSCCLAALA
jgi:hypothetical protein